MIVAALGGLSIGQSAVVAIVPAFFGGWFYGGTFFLMRAAERKDDAPVLQSPEEEVEAGTPKAA